MRRRQASVFSALAILTTMVMMPGRAVSATPDASCGEPGAITVSPGLTTVAAAQTFTVSATLEGQAHQCPFPPSTAEGGTVTGVLHSTSVRCSQPGEAGLTGIAPSGQLVIRWSDGTRTTLRVRLSNGAARATGSVLLLMRGKASKGVYAGAKTKSRLPTNVGSGQDCSEAAPVTSYNFPTSPTNFFLG